MKIKEERREREKGQPGQGDMRVSGAEEEKADVDVHNPSKI
jgi:hypothetical protein